MTTSQNIYAIKDRAPEFPCWVYVPESRNLLGCWLRCSTEKMANIPMERATHWTDAPEAPKDAPGDDIRRELTKGFAGLSHSASPELPESVRQAINDAILSWQTSGRVYGLHEKIHAALTPLWLSADGRKESTAQYVPTPSEPVVVDKALGGLFSSTPSPVAGLPTPETNDKVKELCHSEMSMADRFNELWKFSCSLERRLAAARAEVEEERKMRQTMETRHGEVVADLVAVRANYKNVSGHYDEAVQELVPLRAQLATAKEELVEAINERDGFRVSLVQAQTKLGTANAIIQSTNEQLQDWKSQSGVTQQLLDSTRSDLAKANAAVEDCRSAERCLSDAYLRLRKLIPGAFITPTAPTAEQVWATTEEGLAKMVAQLAAQQSVPPEARAVELEEILRQETHLNAAGRARLAERIQRTLNPTGEGEASRK